jgi:hypothetical protein
MLAFICSACGTVIRLALHRLSAPSAKTSASISRLRAVVDDVDRLRISHHNGFRQYELRAYRDRHAPSSRLARIAPLHT